MPMGSIPILVIPATLGTVQSATLCFDAELITLEFEAESIIMIFSAEFITYEFNAEKVDC